MLDSTDIFKAIFLEPEFKDQPPVLLDIGASIEINREWKAIAPYSICIAFDADEREFTFTESQHSEFKKLYVFNCIAGLEDKEAIDFHLTRFPFCSSVLEPDTEHISDWHFWEYFEKDKVVKLKSRSLFSVIKELKLEGVDWFKTDSQGIDLRLFSNLGEEIMAKVLVADFEPGIIDAYKGEDKLYELFQFMDQRPFWMCNLEVKGAQRISRELMEAYAGQMEKINLSVSPGWAEVSYLNTMKNPVLLTKRDVLLAWVFATIRLQHGFALELIRKNEQLIPDVLYAQLRVYSETNIFSKKTPSMSGRIRNKILRIMNKLMGG
jgi:hypothetical protein